MKKILALVMMMSLGLFALCGCGEGTDDQQTGGVSSNALSAQLAAQFTDLVAANPNASGEEIADMLIAGDLLNGRDLSTYNMLDTEFMVGFDADFAPAAFEKATYIQTYSNDVFAGYVYQLADGADTKAFAEYLEQHADADWSGAHAEQMATAEAGNLVFFVMLCEAAPEQPDYNQQLVDRFLDYMGSNADSSAESIANHICGIDGFPLELSAVPVESGYLAGLDEFTQFADGAAFAPMIGSIPFMGYVFMLDADVNAGDVVDAIKAQANLAWNVCTEADVLLTSTYQDAERNAVLVIMAPETY